MASLYTRKDSPFYWVKFRGMDGLIKQVSTRCRVGGPGEEKRRAKAIEAEHSLAELKGGAVLKLKAGWAWVPDWLRVRYRNKRETLTRYLTAWATLRLFIEEREILAPTQFLREHCFDFVTWRQQPDVGKGKYRAGLNTALLEIKTLRLIMHEAMERKLISGNPCVKLGIEREPGKVKSEMSAEDCQKIRESISAMDDGAVKEMFSMSFEIARHQGCRLMETQLNPLTDVQIREGDNTITFMQKGRRVFTTALHPALVPLFERLKREGRATTWSTPAGKHKVWASSRWHKLLKQLGLGARGITFHSTRVTVVTELVRGGVEEPKAMGYVGHASTTVHRIYQRLRPKDLGDCTKAVG